MMGTDALMFSQASVSVPLLPPLPASVYFNSSTSAGGFAAFGPFFIGGSGSSRSGSGDTKRDYGFRYENNTMFVDGMQLIGFKCHVMPKSPDPDPAIPAADWI